MTDGLSNTYLLGEKYLEPDCYATGESPGDNDWAMAGYNFNMDRYANWGPPTNPPYQTPPVQLPDTPGYNACYNFGSTIWTALTWRSAMAPCG